MLVTQRYKTTRSHATRTRGSGRAAAAGLRVARAKGAKFLAVHTRKNLEQRVGTLALSCRLERTDYQAVKHTVAHVIPALVGARLLLLR